MSAMRLISLFTKKLLTMGLIAGMCAALSVPARAQFSDSYNFLKSVRDRDGDKVTQVIDKPGSGQVMINTRDSTTGETALHIVITGRDSRWTSFLLAKGANPNVADKKGTTPLMLAVQLDFVDGVDALIRSKANVDMRNRSGETALIRAVQLRNLNMVRTLIKAGANPDLKDNLAGMSALDYAIRDGRNASMIDALQKKEASPSAATSAGKKEAELDFSGLDKSLPAPTPDAPKP